MSLLDPVLEAAAPVVGIDLPEARAAGSQVTAQGASLGSVATAGWPSACDGLDRTSAALGRLRATWPVAVAEAGASLRSLGGFTSTTANAFQTAGG